MGEDYKVSTLTYDHNGNLLKMNRGKDTGSTFVQDYYEARMAIASRSQGKSSRVRIITFVKLTQDSISLLAIYDKSEKENLEPRELETYLELIKDDTEAE